MTWDEFKELVDVYLEKHGQDGSVEIERIDVTEASFAHLEIESDGDQLLIC